MRITSEPGSVRPVHAVRFLPPGDHSVAVTCLGDQDAPGGGGDLAFRRVVNVELNAAESAHINLD
jgi:hypothetical protein